MCSKCPSKILPCTPPGLGVDPPIVAWCVAVTVSKACCCLSQSFTVASYQSNCNAAHFRFVLSTTPPHVAERHHRQLLGERIQFYNSKNHNKNDLTPFKNFGTGKKFLLATVQQVINKHCAILQDATVTVVFKQKPAEECETASTNCSLTTYCYRQARSICIQRHQ